MPGSAVAKRTITQRSFALGEIIGDFLEGDDLEVRQNSMREAPGAITRTKASMDAGMLTR